MAFPGVSSDEIALEGHGDGFDAALQLAEDVADVRFDRVFR